MTRRDDFRLAALVGAVAMLVACGEPPEPPVISPTMAVCVDDSRDHMPVIQNLLMGVDSGAVIRPTGVVEPGNEAHRNLILGGWGQPEVHGETGRTFAWVTALEAEIRMTRLHEGAARITVTGWPFRWEGSPPQVVTVRVNGLVAGSEEMRRGRQSLDFEIPEGWFHPGPNSVGLVFSRATAPREVVDGSRDKRWLAAAIESIEVRDEFAAPGGDAGKAGVRLTDGGELNLDSQGAVEYRLMPVGEVAVDLEVAATDPTKNPRLVVWVTPVGGDPVCVVDDFVSEDGSRRRVRLSGLDGQRVDVGLAAVGGPVTIRRAELVGSGRVESTKNILMIVIDTLRADYVGFMGGDVHTPNIDALAANGVVFEHAYAPIPITGPSHSSLFTSVNPHEHGVQNNGQILASSWWTLAEALEDAGWHTSAAVSLGVLNRGFGYRQGFQNYLDSFGRDWMKDAAEVTDEVLELVETGLPSPYFLFVHYSDPHEPYTPPGLTYPKADLRFRGETLEVIEAHGRGNRIPVTVPPGRHALDFIPHTPSRRLFRADTLRVIGKGVEVEASDAWDVAAHHKRAPATYTSRFPATLHLINDGSTPREVALDFTFKEYLSIAEVKVRYRQEVEFADAQIGRLLDGLRQRDLLRDTIIVFTSDHGEGLGQHNHLAHIHQVYDTLIRVPLMISLPGDDRPARRVEQRVSLVDVFPTLAELLGVDPPNPASGRSLVPLLQGEVAQELPILAMTYRPEAFTEKRAIIVDDYKFIHSWSDEREWEELYNLAADPDELVDLIHDEPEIANRLRAALTERLRGGAGTRAEEAELSQQDLDRLQALGYVH